MSIELCMTEGTTDTSVCCIHVLHFPTDNLAEQHCLPALRPSWVALLSVSWQYKNTPHALVAMKPGLNMLPSVP